MFNAFANIMGLMSQFKSNPMAMLTKRFNLPQNMAQDPQEILTYLVNSGQVSQEQINNVMQFKNMFQR